MLDKSAKATTIAIYSSFKLLIQKTKAFKKKKPQQNEKYCMCFRTVRQTQKYQVFDKITSIKDFNANTIWKKTRLILCIVVKKAKQNYYQKFIDRLDYYKIFYTVK